MVRGLTNKSLVSVATGRDRAFLLGDMKLQGELKSFKAKGLVSGDRGLEIKLYVSLDESVDVNELRSFLLEPIEVEIRKHE